MRFHTMLASRFQMQQPNHSCSGFDTSTTQSIVVYCLGTHCSDVVALCYVDVQVDAGHHAVARNGDGRDAYTPMAST